MEEEQFEKDMVEISNEDDYNLVLQNLTSVRTDLKTFEKNLESEKRGLDRYAKQYEIAKELRSIIEADFKKVSGQETFEFEKNPRFWELRLEETQYKHAQEDYLDQSKIAQFENTIDKLTEAIEIHTKKIAVLESALTAYKGEDNE